MNLGFKIVTVDQVCTSIKQYCPCGSIPFWDVIFIHVSQWVSVFFQASASLFTSASNNNLVPVCLISVGLNLVGINDIINSTSCSYSWNTVSVIVSSSQFIISCFFIQFIVSKCSTYSCVNVLSIE